MIVNGDRLAINLWQSAPPSGAAQMRRETGGCLTLNGVRVVSYRASASGSEHNLFENQFQLILRSANGRVLAARHIAAIGPWNAQLSYHADRRQAGTLEVSALSAKDGSLVCLAQLRVRIHASPRAAVQVLARYRAACLRAVKRPADAGLIAAARRAVVVVAHR